MKRTRLLLAAIAGASLLLAATGCSVENESTSDAVSTDSSAFTETLDGTSVSGYALATDNFSTYLTTVSGVTGIDCDAAESTTTYDASAKVKWDNPLSGKTLSSGATIVLDVYNTSGAIYDALLTFCQAGATVTTASDGAGSTTSALSIFEAGNWRYNNSGVYFDYENTITAGSWAKVALVLGTDGSITEYVDGTVATIKNSASTWSDMNTFLTSTCNEIAVGVGYAWFWKAGYVDPASYLANIKIYTTALTSAQVSAL